MNGADLLDHDQVRGVFQKMGRLSSSTSRTVPPPTAAITATTPNRSKK